MADWTCVHLGIKSLEKPDSLIHSFFFFKLVKRNPQHKNIVYGEPVRDRKQKQNIV